MSGEPKLIKDCLKGNRIAQKQLYDCYAAPMLGLCARYTKSIAEAEDVLQEAFVKVFTKLHQYKGEGALGAWIRRIVVNTAITHINKSRTITYELTESEEGETPTEDPDIMGSLTIKDIISHIRSLPQGYQLVFNLFAVEGYSHEEIGKLLGIKPSSSRSQFLRARGMLIRKLREQEQLNIKVLENG